MAVSYKKLWKLLIDKDMKKKDLRIATGMTKQAIDNSKNPQEMVVSVLALLKNM